MLAISFKHRFRWTRAAVLVTAGLISACAPRNTCDMTPDGSVWLTVARFTDAEEIYRKAHGHYGKLVEMTELQPGLPADVTAGQMGSYTITIELTKTGYILRANPDHPHGRRRLASFYANETGIITVNRSGKPADPDSEPMGNPRLKDLIAGLWE